MVEGRLGASLVVTNSVASQGLWTSTDGGWAWDVGNLPADAVATLNLELEGLATGVVTNEATAMSAEADPSLLDRTAMITTEVRLETDLGITQSLASTPILLSDEAVFSRSGGHGSFASRTRVH
jgi:hypothetical protein